MYHKRCYKKYFSSIKLQIKFIYYLSDLFLGIYTDEIMLKHWGTKVYWHSAGFLDWPFPMLKCDCIFQIKYTEANQTALRNWYGLKSPKC